MIANISKDALRGDKQAQADCTAEGVLLPCPFCGGEVPHDRVQESWNGGWVVSCGWCGAQIHSSPAEEAVSEWNTRASTEVHGMWICNPDVEKVSLVCSVCGQVMPFVPEYLPKKPPFCNCGAKMDGGIEDGKVD